MRLARSGTSTRTYAVTSCGGVPPVTVGAGILHVAEVDPALIVTVVKTIGAPTVHAAIALPALIVTLETTDGAGTVHAATAESPSTL